METREKLLETAEKLFAERGYERTSMDAVAKEAGLSKGAIYYQFRSKADLFCAVIEEGLKYIEEFSDRAMEMDLSNREIARDIIRKWVDMAYDHPRMSLLLLGDQLRASDDVLRSKLEPALLRMIGIAKSLLEKGMRYGVMNRADTDVTAKAVLGMIYAMLAYPGGVDRRTASKTILTIMEGMLTREEGK